jgi:hypothetical protein
MKCANCISTVLRIHLNLINTVLEYKKDIYVPMYDCMKRHWWNVILNSKLDGGVHCLVKIIRSVYNISCSISLGPMVRTTVI